jgi:PTH1 family peptidyl-tRNA hydrolase
MKLIAGLGNPGKKYQNTRHNLGFMALDALLADFESAAKTFWEERKDLKSHIKLLKTTNDERRTTRPLLLAKPATFMNNSGFAVSKVLNYYKIEPTELIVIHDDSDLPLGKTRVRFGGAAGGHRGVQSIIDTLKTDKFLRVRLGIGRPTKSHEQRATSQNLDRYVLAPFGPGERNKVKHMIKGTVQIIELILTHGLETYMSKHNK